MSENQESLEFLQRARRSLRRRAASGAPQDPVVVGRSLLTSSSTPTDRKKESALASERAHPTDLSKPALEMPVVRCRREQFFHVLTQHGARVRAQVLDAILCKPALHLGKRVTVLFRM